MGYKLIKELPGNAHNVKRFYLDNGAADLPPIKDKVSIGPGSEAWDLNSTDMWILSDTFVWEKAPWNNPCGCAGGSGGGISDIPNPPTGVSYVRYSTVGGNVWKAVNIMEDTPDTPVNTKYVRETAADGTHQWVELNAAEELDSSAIPGVKYARMIDSTGQKSWTAVNEITLTPSASTAAWQAMSVKPDLTNINDSIYDGYTDGHI